MKKNVTIQIDETDDGILYVVMTDTGHEVVLIGSGQDDVLEPVLEAINQLVERTFK